MRHRGDAEGISHGLASESICLNGMNRIDDLGVGRRPVVPFLMRSVCNVLAIAMKRIEPLESNSAMRAVATGDVSDLVTG